MVVVNGSMSKLSELFLPHNQTKTTIGTQDWMDKRRYGAQKQWRTAIASLEQLLITHAREGLILSGPVPVLAHTQLLQNFYTGIFTPSASHRYQLPTTTGDFLDTVPDKTLELPLLAEDPLINEQFCLVFTPDFSVLMVLGEDEWGLSAFNFSFAPETTLSAWKILQSRLTVDHYQGKLEDILGQFPPSEPSYKLVSEFSRHLLNNISDHDDLPPVTTPPQAPDIELLQALSHEIRTPLTTIRTMTRLLLKRASLTADVVKCLEVIDQECTEQINRMELILKAAEMGTTPSQEPGIQLVPTSIEQVFQQSIPHWQKQAKRRNVELDVVLPQNLPQITSDPRMLNQMLTGLMEKCTRNVPTGGHIRVQVTTAGHQLKLQVYSEAHATTNPLKALGQLLMFQPETGSVSLNLDVTKNLFNALGCKLVVRQRPHEGEIMTVFLPLDNEHG